MLVGRRSVDRHDDNEGQNKKSYESHRERPDVTQIHHHVDAVIEEDLTLGVLHSGEEPREEPITRVWGLEFPESDEYELASKRIEKNVK